MRNETAKNISEFIEHTEVFDILAYTVLFRGQPVQGNLLPAVARKAPHIDSTDKEKEVLEQLKLMGATLLDGNENNYWDLLVLAQHFGMKTRLLDWSSNPLAAMWFACRTSGGI